MARIIPHDEIIALLQNSPVVLTEMVAGVPPDLLSLRPEPDEWSVLENVHHMYACEVVWGQRIYDMLEQDHPTLLAVNPKLWQRQNPVGEESFGILFGRFTTHRLTLLETLQALSLDQWNRRATFRGGGKPREYSVHGQADALARHERAHVKTIGKMLKLARAD